MTEMSQNPYRKLYRSRTNRMVAGVLGGVAEYANLDPTLLRVVFALLVVFTGGGALLAYPILWIIMPETPEQPAGWTPTAPTSTPTA